MKRSLFFSALAMLLAASNAMGQLTQSKLFIENGSNITTIFGSSGMGAITLPAVTGTAITTGNLSLITATGTIGSGIWQGTLIGATYGGTGVNNGVNTITLNGANFALSHGDNLTLTTTAATNVTLPTSGILATTANVSSSVNTAVSGTSGHLAAFNGTNSIGNTDLTSDVTTSGGIATTISSTGAAGNTAGTHIVSAINSASTTGTINLVNGGTGASTASGARTNLGLGTLATQNGTFSGTSSGTNTGDVTLTQTGGETYLTLSGQALTANPVDLSTANATGTLAAGRFPALAGDVATTAGSLTTTVSKVNGVSYGTSPSTNTVPVVTGTNAITYEAVPNTALANNSITIQGTAVALGGSALATNSSPTFAGETLSSFGTGIVHSGSGGALSSTLLVDADVSATAAIADSKLATISTAGKVANSATTATTASTASTIVLRDGSGNIPGSITGNAATVTTDANLTGPVSSTGNATAIANNALSEAMVNNLTTDLGNKAAKGANADITSLTGLTGAVSGATTVSASTSMTSPIHYGGSAANSTLTLQSTSGNGTSDAINMKVGNNGAMQALNINTSGVVGIGSTQQLTVGQTGNLSTSGTIATTGSGTITSAGLLTGSAGLTVSGGNTSLNNNDGANTVNIGTGTTTGVVTIGNTTGGVAIGSGAAIKKVLTGTSTTTTMPAVTVSAKTTVSIGTISVTGANTGDAVILGTPTAVENISSHYLTYTAYVSASGTVTVIATNADNSTSVNVPASSAWRAVVIQF